MIPVFIIVLFTIISVLYTTSLTYFYFEGAVSMVHSVIWFIVYAALIVGIFLGIPASYKKNIASAEEDYEKHQDETSISDSLKAQWVSAVSSKNKYFITWFILILYIPIGFHFMYKCKINPFMYGQVYTFIQKYLRYGETNGVATPFIEPVAGVANILNELDKLKLTYTNDEKELFGRIRDSIEQKKEMKLESKDIIVLKKLRYHLERDNLWKQFKGKSVSSSPLGGLSNISPTVLYIFNLFVISAVSAYIFLYSANQSYFIIPIFTVLISATIYYLQ